MFPKLSLTLLVLNSLAKGALSHVVRDSQATTTLQPYLYNHLPLGQIQPNGWLANQLAIQANGLAGHQHDFYDYVANGTWTGGTSTYSDLNEGGSYWFNGLVTHAYMANDSRLKGQVQSFLTYVLNNQGSDGWLGPSPRTLWGRYPALLGMMQMAEADPTYTTQIVNAMYKFVTLANSMLHNNYTGVEEWGAARWQDFTLVLQWLFDNHPNGNQSLLLDTMNLLQASGTNWTDVYSAAKFPTGDVGSAGATVLTHGVNLGQALKEGAIAYRMTGNTMYQTSTQERWDILYKYHGRPSGTFGADEHLAGLAANRGSELCTVVETMYSGSVTYQMWGNSSIADLVERQAWNALPATLTSNMWSRQYLQQMNQVWAKSLNPNIFATDGSCDNVYGLEPNYPCCTVNHPQGFPKFVSNSFVKTADGNSLVQVYLGPFIVSTTLGTSNNVKVTVNSNYPFADTLNGTITATSAYTHYIRIPAWAITNGKGTISINGGAATALSVNANNLLSIAAAAGTTTYVLTVPANIATTYGPTGGVQVSRGNLLFASDIFRQETVLSTNPLNSNAQDIQMTPTAGYNFAIDPATLAYHNTLPATLPNPIFEGQQPPNTITATGCPITWTTTSGSLDNPPSGEACTGSQFNFIYWPFASCKLHVSELPTFKST